MTANNDDFISDLQAEIQAAACSLGLRQDDAVRLSELALDGIMERRGGTEPYIPKLDRKRRERAIMREFTGANQRDICAKYGISRARLYQILGRKPKKSNFPPKN